MKRRTLLAAATTAIAAGALPARPRAEEKTKIVFWHAMTAALSEEEQYEPTSKLDITTPSPPKYIFH